MREQHLPETADPLPGSELLGWANTIRQLQPGRDPAEFDRTKLAIGAALERIARMLPATR